MQEMAEMRNILMAPILFALVALLYTASPVDARIKSDDSVSCSTSY